MLDSYPVTSCGVEKNWVAMDLRRISIAACNTACTQAEGGRLVRITNVLITICKTILGMHMQ